MKTLSRLAVLVVAGLMLSKVAAHSAEPKGAPEPPPEQKRDALIAKATTAPLQASDSFALCLSYFELGQFREAQTTAQLAVGTTTNAEEKAVFYAIISQAQGALGDHVRAAQSALEGQRLNPKSAQLARQRIFYFDKCNDEARRLPAQFHYKSLDPQGASDAQQVFNPVAALQFIVSVYRLAVVIYQVEKEVWPVVKPYVKEVIKIWVQEWPGRFGTI